MKARVMIGSQEVGLDRVDTFASGLDQAEGICDPGIVVPDGIAATSEGGLVIACYRPDALPCWHPDRGLATLAADPRGTVLAAPTNAVFTGPDPDPIVFPNLGRSHLTRGRFGMQGVPVSDPTIAQLGV